MIDGRLPQPGSRQFFSEFVVLIISAAWSLLYFYILMQGIDQFYYFADVLTYLLMAGIYGFFSMFLLDFSQTWVYLPWGVINAALAFFCIYRIYSMAGAGLMALFLNAFLFLVPMALFAIMWIHLSLRKKHQKEAHA